MVNRTSKKMYLVRREVMATSLEKALTAPGKIYSVEIADEKFQSAKQISPLGFKTNGKKKS